MNVFYCDHAYVLAHGPWSQWRTLTKSDTGNEAVNSRIDDHTVMLGYAIIYCVTKVAIRCYVKIIHCCLGTVYRNILLRSVLLLFTDTL